MRWISWGLLLVGCGGSPAPEVTWVEPAEASAPDPAPSVAIVEDASLDVADEIWATIDTTDYGYHRPPPGPPPAPIPPQTVPPPSDAAPSLPVGQCAPSCMNNDTCNYSCPRRSGVWCCTAGTCSPFSSSRCP